VSLVNFFISTNTFWRKISTTFIVQRSHNECNFLSKMWFITIYYIVVCIYPKPAVITINNIFRHYESDFYFNLCYNTNYAFFDSHMYSKNLTNYCTNETLVIHFILLMQIVYSVKFIIFYDKN